jgi:hypothetical protein
MLGEPEAAVAPAFRMLSEIARVAKRLGCIAPFDDRRKVQDRESGIILGGFSGSFSLAGTYIVAGHGKRRRR